MATRFAQKLTGTAHLHNSTPAQLTGTAQLDSSQPRAEYLHAGNFSEAKDWSGRNELNFSGARLPPAACLPPAPASHLLQPSPQEG